LKKKTTSLILGLKLSVAYLVAAAAAAAAKTARITHFSGIVLNMLLFTE